MKKFMYLLGIGGLVSLTSFGTALAFNPDISKEEARKFIEEYDGRGMYIKIGAELQTPTNYGHGPTLYDLYHQDLKEGKAVTQKLENIKQKLFDDSLKTAILNFAKQVNNYYPDKFTFYENHDDYSVYKYVRSELVFGGDKSEVKSEAIRGYIEAKRDINNNIEEINALILHRDGYKEVKGDFNSIDKELNKNVEEIKTAYKKMIKNKRIINKELFNIK